MSPDLSPDQLARIRSSAPRPVVLIDGRSGAGKTTLANSLAPRLGAQLVSLDDIYPGWDGLAAGSDAVHETVLHPENPGWWRWDWASGRRAGWHPLDPRRPVVVEGCGALSRASRALASFGIWVDAPAGERRRRALERDPGFAPHWDDWAEQEDAHIAREAPRSLADLVV